MELTNIGFHKSDLEKIPEKERTLFISLAHAANELNVLSKLFQISIKNRPENEIERHTMVVQGLLFARLLSGKLYESWVLFRTVFYNSKLALEYEPQFARDTIDALCLLKKYFSSSNPINTVRNKHAFHYSLEELKSGYDELKEEQLLELFLNSSTANTMYSFADVIANLAWMKSVDSKDSSLAMTTFMEDTSKASGWLNLVIGECLTITVKQFLKHKFEEESVKKIQIPNAPDWDTLSLPFFTESPKSFRLPLNNGNELIWGDSIQMAPKFE